MRLLQRQCSGSFSLTPQLHDHKIPLYDILSHTREDEDQEIVFDVIPKRTYQDKEGYKKLKFCVDQAAKDNLELFWYRRWGI